MTAPSLECLLRMAEVLDIDLDPQETNVVDLDDHRHGTYAGAVQHWTDRETTCDPCRLAANRSRKRRKYAEHRGQPVQVDAAPTIRRLHALAALGYSMPTIARHAGVPAGTLHRLIATRNPAMRRATADAVTATYNALHMTIPTGRYVTRDRARAVEKGWLPPLAWADIEAGIAAETRRVSRLEWFDEVTVERIVGGDGSLAAGVSRPERLEVIRRWRALGRSDKALERLTGWQHLYRKFDDQDAAA